MDRMAAPVDSDPYPLTDLGGGLLCCPVRGFLDDAGRRVTVTSQMPGTLQGLAAQLEAEPALAATLEEARSNETPALDLTAVDALHPFVIAGLVRSGRTVLGVTATTREAEALVEALCDLVDPARVAYYPSWETLPHERLSPRSDTVGRRLAVLRRLAHPESTIGGGHGPLDVVITPVRSLLQPQARGLGDLAPVSLTEGDEVSARSVWPRSATAKTSACWPIHHWVSACSQANTCLERDPPAPALPFTPTTIAIRILRRRKPPMTT